MKRFLVGLVIFKITVAVLYCFVGFANPHIIRQSVTMAVSQRYVIDWKYHEKDYAWLPRSLAGGDQDAILEMEFPLLNYLTVPAFYLETETARTVARFIHLFLAFGLWLLHYRIWKDQKILGISCEIPSLILVLIPISGTYFHRFMPDFFSFILCSMALGISFKHPKKILWPFILATLGLLEKPTAIIAFGPLLLLPQPIQQIRQRLMWLLPCGLIMLAYYAFGIKWIRSLSDLDRYYMTDLRDPWASLIEFIKTPKGAVKLFIEQLTTPYLPLIALGFWAYKKFPRPQKVSLSLWALLVLQFVVIVLMDGAHSIIHPYYYVGLSMTGALLWAYYFNASQNKKWQMFMIAPLFLFTVEHSFYELRDAVIPRQDSVQSYWQSCKILKNRHPEWPWSQGYSFRSVITPISEISVCFGEIQSSKTSEFGFYMTGENIPEECNKIDQDGDIILVKCPP